MNEMQNRQLEKIGQGLGPSAFLSLRNTLLKRQQEDAADAVTGQPVKGFTRPRKHFSQTDARLLQFARPLLRVAGQTTNKNSVKNELKRRVHRFDSAPR